VAAQPSDAPESQPAELPTRKPMAVWWKVLVPREAASADGPVERLPAWLPPEAPNEELEQSGMHSRKPLEAVLRVSPAAQQRSRDGSLQPEAQPQAFPREEAPQWALQHVERPVALRLPFSE